MDRDDRHRAPPAPLADRNIHEIIDRPLGLLAFSIITPFSLSFAAAIVMNAMPGYDDTFTQLGLPLGIWTRLALRSAPVWWLLTAASLGLAIVVVRASQASEARFRTLRRTGLVIVAVSVLLGGFVVYGILDALSRFANVT